ncbi:MAG: hypothetical protein FJ138_06205 [Deltaproteobacteria bacterium]|nr:hypothetical protein [Deltaproteobacteria bacterium]
MTAALSGDERAEIEEALRRYGLEGGRARRLTEGLIHRTYLLETPAGAPAGATGEGEGARRLILQGLHPQLSAPETLEDYAAVTRHLAARGYGGPRLLPTLDGALSALTATRRWRLSTFVEGCTLPHIEDEAQARLGGRALAEFHEVMSDLAHEFRSPHPGHDTRGHARRLREALDAPAPDPARAAAVARVAPRARQLLAALDGAFLPDDLPRTVVHGDPKVTNLRFSEGRATLIDLDTCGRHSRLVDIGDAIRSWCDLGREGARGVEEGEPVFSLSRCAALLEGYLSASGPLAPLERAWLPRCGRAITLELAARFARDYIEDCYFAFDAARFENRRAHNLHRVEAMWRLAEEMAAAEGALGRLAGGGSAAAR